jgi:hypothetical protein
MGKYLDPIRTRLSDTILLSDLMGCTSVYRKGLPNVFEHDPVKLREGHALAETLEQISALAKSPLSFVYGFISPQLSWEIVKYQHPDKPSYHRWDAGAAVDFCAHNHVRGKANDLSNAPISLAWQIENSDIPYSRMITYSESPIICFATRADEKRPRKAFYENRYQGELGGKPKYIAIPNGKKRQEKFQELHQEGLPDGWKGHGFPTYHLGGKRGYEHYRTSRYTLLSDFLYDNRKVRDGEPNMPRVNRDLRSLITEVAGHVDVLVDAMGGKRVSIVRGLHQTWYSEAANLIVALPKSEHTSMGDYAELLRKTGCDAKAGKEFLCLKFPERRLAGV